MFVFPRLRRSVDEWVYRHITTPSFDHRGDSRYASTYPDDRDLVLTGLLVIAEIVLIIFIVVLAVGCRGWNLALRIGAEFLCLGSVVFCYWLITAIARGQERWRRGTTKTAAG